MEENTHQAVVVSWLRRAPDEPQGLVRAFEATFAALWQRTRLTLGDMTLTAIVDRVLHVATEQFPVLGSFELVEGGLRWSEPPPAPGVVRDRLPEGIRFVLVEFLTVLGNLTAEILTPALHAEMSRSGSPTDDSEDGES